MDISILKEIFGSVSSSCDNEELTLKVCGSYGIYLQIPYLVEHLRNNSLETSLKGLLYQNYRAPRDIDFVASFRKKTEIEKLFLNLGFERNKMLASIPGAKRSIFKNEELKIDVFYDVFDFNHLIDMQKRVVEGIDKGKKRIEVKGATIPITELLLQKLQIVEIGEKDLINAWWILKEFPISNEYNDSKINLPLLNEYLSKDWGFYTTVSENLIKLQNMIGTSDDDVFSASAQLLKELREAPKSFSWKARSIIGKKMDWYTEVEHI